MKTKNNKPMDDVMQANPELLPLIMNNIPQAVFWKDRNLVYLGCNQAFADDAGFSSPEDVVGKTDFDMPWKAQAELYRADDSAVMEKGEPKINYEEPQTTPNGSTIWLSTSKIPVRENGQVVAVLGMYEDITPRKQVEKDLLLRDRALASSLNAVVILNLKDSKPIYVNDAILKMTGYTREEVMQIGLSDITGSPAEPEKIRASIQAQGYFTGEELIKRKDGSVFSANFFSSLITDDKGQPIAVQSSFFNITERKQAEEATRQSQARFQTMVETLGEWVWEVDSKGTYTYISPNIKNLLGYEPEEVLGKTPFDLMPPEEAQRVAGVFGPLLSTQQPLVGLENTNRHKDGSLVVLETNGVPFFDANGQLLGYRGTDRNVTERKKTEESLQESEERFRRFTEATIEGLVFHEQGKIIDANPAALAMYGLSDNSEFIGRNLLEFIVPEDRPLVLKQMQLETVQPYEIQCFRSDGTAFPVETSTRIYNLGSRTIRASAIRDITARKQAEQALRDNQQLLQIVMDNIPLSVFWKDSQLNYMGCNRAFAADVGLALPSDVIGKSDYDMPSADRAEHYRADDSLVMNSGVPKINFEEPQTTPDGTTNWLRTSKMPMRDADGKVFAMLGLYEDITEQKRLQQRVQDLFERRGYQVQVSTEISQEVAAATELDELFKRVVTLTKERLGYYHTQLLRYDAAQDAVVLINGYGETGQKMLEGGHKMPMGSGLIGAAAESGQTVLRPTLADDPDWHPNPLLPETKGEIAVPIKWQDNVLGVLDVQSDQAGALAEDDRLLLEGLCGQIAIAMHSAELVEAVRENEARLAEALKTARLANWEYDVEKDIFTFNDQFYSIFHTTAEKVGGYQLSSARYSELLVHPDDLPMVGTEIGKALSSTERVYNATLDHRILYADGGVGYIMVKLTVERDENGKITRYYGANQDITERKQTEARLAEALTAARLANWEYDVEKDIFTFNDQFYSIFHTTAEKVGGYQLSSARYSELLVHPDDLPMVGTEIGKALSSTERVYNATLDHRILYADGGVGYITVKLTVERDENGKITRYYGANQDITEQRKAQEELAERLEEINRLYQNLSHEGWKTYRETADLPAGFIFDQTGTKPMEGNSLEDGGFDSVPMKVLGGEVVGTLAVANDPRSPTSPEDLAFFQQVSDQIALALEGARLSAQTQSALAQSERLFESSRLLTQAAGLQELTATTVSMLGIPAINRALLTTFNYDAQDNIESLDIAANWWNGTGHEITAVGTHYPYDVIRTMSFFISPTPVFFGDTHTDERVDAATMKLVERLNLRAVAVLPLYTGARQIGALILEAEEPHNFTQEETRLFSALAPQISTILENRRQFERAQQQAERESTLNVISQKIQSATTVEAVLQIAARELGHALGAPMTVAQLSMKDKK